MEEIGRASVAVIVREQNDVGKGIAAGVKIWREWRRWIGWRWR